MKLSLHLCEVILPNKYLITHMCCSEFEYVFVLIWSQQFLYLFVSAQKFMLWGSWPTVMAIVAVGFASWISRRRAGLHYNHLNSYINIDEQYSSHSKLPH